MSGSTEHVASPSTSITTVRRAQFDPDQVALIQATVAKDCNAPELALFLETCVRHDLDPFIKEIWAYKIKGRVVTVVSRDGLLKVANRNTGQGWSNQPGEFLGCQSNVVHEHDHFDVQYTDRPDGTIACLVDHSPRDKDGKPTFGGKDMKGRGEIVGAWARVRRRGHDDVMFMAPRAEYDKAENVWQSHPHAMMVKVAEAMALRKAFSIAGVVGEGEVEQRGPINITAVSEGGGDEIRWPEDEELTESLRSGFELLGYRRAKVRSLVNACDSLEDFGHLLQRLHSELDESQREEEKIPEAEVVG